jgi:predicted AAA+ superfamily ATPase
MWIYRNQQAQLIDLIAFYPALAVIGSRQVGKTSLVKQVQKVLPKPSLYLDMERAADRRKLSDPDLFLTAYENQTVILDEVQLIPALFPEMRSLIDRHREPGRFILLGSASPNLLTRSGESLAGRIAYLELEPIHIREAAELPAEQHWLRGGYPESLLAPSDALSFNWRDNFLKNIAFRDLPALGLRQSPVNIQRFMIMLAGLQGGLLNISQLANSLAVSRTALIDFVDFLENSFLCRRLQPYYANIGKRLTKIAKFYFRDSGLVHLLLNIENRNQLFGHPLAGELWEGYVIQQIITRLSSGTQAYFYRTQDGSELDLVLVQGNRPVVTIEIKLSNAPTLSRGNTIAMQDLKTEHNFIITPSAGDYPLRPNVQVTDIQTIWAHLMEIGVVVNV